MNKDQEHLKLLSIFHYIIGVIVALFACIPIIHFIIGVIFIISPESVVDKAGKLPPVFFGWLFAVIGGMMVFLGWIFAICLICAGRFLARRRHYLFCLIVAALSCLFFPFGTILGIFTIIVLIRPSVKELFRPHNRLGMDTSQSKGAG